MVIFVQKGNTFDCSLSKDNLKKRNTLHPQIFRLDEFVVGKDCLQIKHIKISWIAHILRRNCLLKHLIEGKIEGAGRRGCRRKQLPDDLNEKRKYWNWKKDALDRYVRRTRLVSGHGTVIR
jgi:hypothetical protein